MKGKILYIHQYFKTPSEGGAIRSYYLAKGFVDDGYVVELITAHDKATYDTKFVDGIKIHYLPVAYDNSFGFLRRIFAFLRFAHQTYQLAKGIPDIRKCYITSTPLTVGLIALALKKWHRIPYIFEVRDLWPEAPIQMGVINNYFSQLLLKKLEKKIYREADKVVALSPGIAAHIDKLVPLKKSIMIPNMSDCSLFLPSTKQPANEVKFQVEGKFVIGYLGAIGKVNHLEFFIEAAQACAAAALDVAFLIVGKGAALSTIQKLVQAKKLKNVSFLSFRNKHALKEVLNITDAVYISFADKSVLETNSPNKFFDGLAAGKLIITNTEGWIRNLCEDNICGIYTDPQQSKRFPQHLLPFLQDKKLLEKYQQNARRLAETTFNKDILIGKLLGELDDQEKFSPDHHKILRSHHKLPTKVKTARAKLKKKLHP